MNKRLITAVLVVGMMFLVGCAGQGQNQQKGTGVGAVLGGLAGAGLGQAIGGDTDATLIGAAIGAAVGAGVGNQVGAYMDRQQAAMQNAMAASIAANQASVNRVSQDMLALNFKSDVFFDLGSSVLKPGAYSELNRVANVLTQYPQTNIQIQGHTDRSGSEQTNMVLSKRRADAVRTVLIQRNVAASRMTSVGLGESQPISSSPAQNRRVTILVTPMQ